jgi:hypothetical protein
MPFQYLNARYSNGTDAIEDMRSFAESISIERNFQGRYSALLLAQLFSASHRNTFDPAKVVWQMKALEGDVKNYGLKSASIFKHPPLAGLWHQHFLMDGISSMAINLQRGLHKFGLPWLEKEVKEITASGEERYLNEEMINRIVHDAVMGNLDRLFEAEALTGEWLIFAKHQDQNYYLSLGGHKSGDEFLRSQIDLIAQTQYPFLNGILTAK